MTQPENVMPLFGTPRTESRPTLGGRAYEVSKRLGKAWLPWQRHVADVALEIDTNTGYLAYSSVTLVCMRQQGKSEFFLPFATHRCTGFTNTLPAWILRELGYRVSAPGPQRVLYFAQNADKSREKWRDIHVARLEKSAYYVPVKQFRTRLQRNFEQILWHDTGSTWSPQSAMAKTGGTGDSTDLGAIDEAWAHDGKIELALKPTMLTRDWSQIWRMSMIPGPKRCPDPAAWQYLRDQIEIGRAAVEAGQNTEDAIFFYGADQKLDPTDPKTWRMSIPALGYTIQERKIAADLKMGLPDFCAEYLSWLPDLGDLAKWLFIPEKIWERDRFDPESFISNGLAIGVHISDDRDKAWIGATGLRDDGDYHVEVLEPGFKVDEDVYGIDWLESRLLDIVDKRKPTCVVIDTTRAASSLVDALKAKKIKVVTPSQLQIAGACGRFYDACGCNSDPKHIDDGRRLWHLGQPELVIALSQANKEDIGNGLFTVVRRGGPKTLGPLYSIILAMHGIAAVPKPKNPEPQIFIDDGDDTIYGDDLD